MCSLDEGGRPGTARGSSIHGGRAGHINKTITDKERDRDV